MLLGLPQTTSYSRSVVRITRMRCVINRIALHKCSGSGLRGCPKEPPRSRVQNVDWGYVDSFSLSLTLFLWLSSLRCFAMRWDYFCFISGYYFRCDYIFEFYFGEIEVFELRLWYIAELKVDLHIVVVVEPKVFNNQFIIFSMCFFFVFLLLFFYIVHKSALPTIFMFWFILLDH